MDLVIKGAKIPKEHWPKILDLQEKYEIAYEYVQRSIPEINPHKLMLQLALLGYIPKYQYLPDDVLRKIAGRTMSEVAEILYEYVYMGSHTIPKKILRKIIDWPMEHIVLSDEVKQKIVMLVAQFVQK